ncbi:MAG: flagellar basal-body MS-ring/collar protein FliF [Desulfonatronovibrionaceae bacterium]
MPQFLNDIWGRMIALWGQSSLAQRIMMFGLLASVVIAFVVLLVYINSTDYKVLYSNVYPKDAARIKEVLDKENVDYKLKDDGRTIMVPSSQVYKLRLSIAGKDIMHGQGTGFELFDETKIGQTEFVQHVNYQRALQGELARTISGYPAVSSARVHLVLPEQSLFIEDQDPTSASIVVNLQQGRKLNEEQVQSIVNLVVSGVEGLDKDNVTISDTRGQVLYEPREESLAGLSSSQLEYQSKVENTLERRVQDILRPIVGAQGVIAKVNADLDFSKRETHKVLYDPDSSVVRSEQQSDETTRGTTNAESGIPEAEYREDEATGTETNQESTRTSSTTNFEINKEEQNIVSPVGKVDRLSVAVLVDGKYAQGGEGEYEYEPLPESTMDRIRELVQRAVGFDEVRGDSLEVSNIAFGPPQKAPEPTIMDSVSRYFDIVGKPLLNTLLVLLFLLLVVRPIVLTILRPRVSEEEGGERGGLPGGEERMALAEGMTEEEMAGMDAKKRVQGVREMATQLVDENFDQAYSVVKKWLREEEK